MLNLAATRLLPDESLLTTGKLKAVFKPSARTIQTTGENTAYFSLHCF